MSRCASLLPLALCATGCAGYRTEALPPPAAAAPARPLELPRLRVAAAKLGRGGAALRIDLSNGLEPDEAAVLAVLLNPDLRAARDQHGEAHAELITAGVLPNPVLGAEYDHPYGPGSAGTSEVWNLSLSMDLKPLFSRSARKSAARAGIAEVDLGIAWQEWQLAERARLLVVRLEWLRHRFTLAREELAFEQQTANVLGRAAAKGDTTLGQLGVQRAALESVRRTTDELEQDAADTESELRALLGNPRWDTLDVPEPGAPGNPTAPDPNACLARRLDLLALERGYEAEEAALRAAVIEQFPDVTLGIAHQHNEAALNFVGAFVNVGLPVFDRNQGAVALAEATRTRLHHEYEARVAATRADLDRLARFSELVARQLPDVQAAVAPLAHIELEERGAAARGDIDRLSYETVRSALFEQRLLAATLSQALAEARIGFETACGPVRP